MQVYVHDESLSNCALLNRHDLRRFLLLRLCTCKVSLKRCFGAAQPVTQRRDGTNIRMAANDVRKIFHRRKYFPQPPINKMDKDRRRIFGVSRFWIRASGIFHVPSLFCGFLKSESPAASSTQCLLTPVILRPGVILR